MIDRQAIRQKFGADYCADERTFIMGIDLRFTTHFAERFRDLQVLETCTGAGFTTISLARSALKVITVEIDPAIRRQAVRNVDIAGLSSQVEFFQGSILDPGIRHRLPPVDGAFLDPDWAVTSDDHVYRFQNANTQPPVDRLLNAIFEMTPNVAMVLPPFVNANEFRALPDHELERLYLGDSHELFCLYFGNLMTKAGDTAFRVPIQ